jgi:very-short-patch-repair endonuclease
MSDTSFQHVVTCIAAAQHGVVTRTQLERAGITARVIDRRIRGGILKTLHRGVFLVGFVEAPLSREMAACLACGEHAFVSRRSAAVMWGIMNHSARPARTEITLRAGYRRRPGIQIHRTGSLPVDETTGLRGVPITSVPRTILDLAAHLHRKPLDRAISQAVALGLANSQALLDVANRHLGRRGALRLRTVLTGPGPAFTRSEAEERFLDLLRRARIDPPEVNTRLLGLEVDFYWPRRQLVVEVDGRAFHSSPLDFERDRARDAELAAVGIRVVRVTWRQLTSAPEAILVRLGGALSASALR